MKLAEALILRADYQRRIEQLKERLDRNVKVQEGDVPAEDPQALLGNVEEVVGQLVTLIQRINRTNVRATLDGSETLADAIARRDNLKLRQDIYRKLAETATVTRDRFTRSEVRFISTINVSEVQKQADDLARAYRELDARIQAANWNTDLAD